MEMVMDEDTISDHYAKIMAEEIQKEIDNSIVESLIMDRYVGQLGWIRVNTVKPITAQYIEESSAWIHINATGDYKYHSGCWYFEKDIDATAFLLKFS